MRFVSGLIARYRDAFGGLPRLTWLLCVAAFLNRCGSMVLPFLGLYAKEVFDYSPKQAGVVLSIYGLGAITGSWLGGVLTDRLGPVRVQVVALSASGLWMFGMTRVLEPGWLEAAVFVLAVCNEAFRPGSMSAVAVSCDPALRRRALSLNRLMLNAGWAFGPTIGGMLVSIDYSLMFWADGGTCLLAAAFLAFGLGGFSPRAVPRHPDERPGRPFRDRYFVWLMLANLIVMLAFMQYFTTGARAWNDHGYGEATIGWFVAVNPIVIVLFEMLVVHGLRDRAPLPVIAVGSLVVALGYLVLLLPFGAAGIMIAMAIVAGGELLQMPLLAAHVNDHAPAHARGAYNGAYGMCFSAGHVVAPLLGGWLYDDYGQAALWWICGGLGALGAVMFWSASRSPQARAGTPQAGNS